MAESGFGVGQRPTGSVGESGYPERFIFLQKWARRMLGGPVRNGRNAGRPRLTGKPAADSPLENPHSCCCTFVGRESFSLQSQYFVFDSFLFSSCLDAFLSVLLRYVLRFGV